MATKVIIQKENFKLLLAKQQVSATGITQRPSWSSKTTTPHVTQFAEGLLKEQ